MRCRWMMGPTLAALALIVAGCGSGTTSPSAATATTAETATTTDTATTADTATTVDVYLQAADIGTDCDQVVAVSRSASGADTPTDTMTQLLAGPTAAEEARSLGSWFSAGTAGMLRSVTIEDGVARVDFDPALPSAIPNASASCGSALLLAQLDATIGQFEGVDRAVYSLGGDVDAFYGWLQMVSPAP